MEQQDPGQEKDSDDVGFPPAKAPKRCPHGCCVLQASWTAAVHSVSFCRGGKTGWASEHTPRAEERPPKNVDRDALVGRSPKIIGCGPFTVVPSSFFLSAVPPQVLHCCNRSRIKRAGAGERGRAERETERRAELKAERGTPEEARYLLCEDNRWQERAMPADGERARHTPKAV